MNRGAVITQQLLVSLPAVRIGDELPVPQCIPARSLTGSGRIIHKVFIPSFPVLGDVLIQSMICLKIELDLRGWRRKGVRGMPLFFYHGVVVHRRLIFDASVDAFEILVKESHLLLQMVESCI